MSSAFRERELHVSEVQVKPSGGSQKKLGRMAEQVQFRPRYGFVCFFSWCGDKTRASDF